MTAMKALVSPGTSGRKKHYRMQRYSSLLGVLLFGAAVSAEEPETKVAVWKVKEVSFSYRSSNAIYSCAALQKRVQVILLALGAREDLQVRVSSCDNVVMEDEFEQTPNRGSYRDRSGGWNPRSESPHESVWEDPYERLEKRGKKREQSAYVRVRAMMPIELTREVRAEIDRDKSRRELVSRVTGDATHKESIGLRSEDCELLDQMSTSILKELDLRVMDKSRKCRSASRGSPMLTVEALLMAPTGATSLPQIPPGETDPKENE